ncbi:MAG: phosphoribosylglycinamide formyltransferase [Muribaculaceae bacterium]|nr:phosphoribosylglycinamide formyltransferase [Muribaculaceae bacterium]
MKHRIAIFASGNGGNFEAIAEAAIEGRMGDVEVALCVCDHPGARVCERAERLGIELLCFNPGDFQNKAAFETMIADTLDSKGIELVCLAGYMRIIGDVLLKRYGGRIINIHPALLPSFPGAHGIRDAYEYGVKVYGVTIHYVDSGVDTGKIIAQRAFPYTGNNLEELEGMIHSVEHPLYVETITQLLKGDL